MPEAASLVVGLLLEAESSLAVELLLEAESLLAVGLPAEAESLLVVELLEAESTLVELPWCHLNLLLGIVRHCQWPHLLASWNL